MKAMSRTQGSSSASFMPFLIRTKQIELRENNELKEKEREKYSSFLVRVIEYPTFVSGN